MGQFCDTCVGVFILSLLSFTLAAWGMVRWVPSSPWSWGCSQQPVWYFPVLLGSAEIRKRMELESIRNLSFPPNFSGKTATLLWDRKRVRREDPEGHQLGAMLFPGQELPAPFLSFWNWDPGCSFCFSHPEWIWLSNPTPAVPTSFPWLQLPKF